MINPPGVGATLSGDGEVVEVTLLGGAPAQSLLDDTVSSPVIPSVFVQRKEGRISQWFPWSGYVILWRLAFKN